MTLVANVFGTVFGLVVGFITARVLDSDKKELNEKPLIRHCRNCEWCKEFWLSSDIECKVTYKTIFNQRTKALLCKYYKQKGE